MYVPSRAPVTMAASTGLIGLVVVENSARPPLAAAQVQAMATRPESASPGRQVSSESLEKAGKSHWPCPICRPPVRKKSAEPAVPGTGRRGA